MKPPTPQEVVEYAKSIDFELDGEYFCDYYEMRGWRCSGNVPMKSWKAGVRYWKRCDKRRKRADPGPALPREKTCYCGKPARLEVSGVPYCSTEHRQDKLGW